MAFGAVISSVVFAGVYITFNKDSGEESQTNTSVFGRNIYSQSDKIGSIANPNYMLSLPYDHRSHEDFDIEWWYLTANLKDKYGAIYGLQWTLFRFRTPVAHNKNDQQSLTSWNNDQVFMAHASIHSINTHWFSEKFARGGVGNAAVEANPLTLEIDDWKWISTTSNENLLPSTLTFSASGANSSAISAHMELSQTGPFVLHGDNGYSVKSTGKHASHYYSAPFISISGMLTIAGIDEEYQEIQVSGDAWFDQEWTSQLLDADTLGWDWLSLHLQDGSKIMAFRMRLKDQSDYVTGSYITKEGIQKTLPPGSIKLIPLTVKNVIGKDLPLTWNLHIPSEDINIVVASIKDNQWNNATIPYYEGMVEVTGSHKGNGFIELSGY